MVDERYRFRYRLLASADIIGSTAFKSGQASAKKAWAHVFKGFFDEFPAELARCFDRVQPDLVGSTLKPRACMDVWKLVGDEILFVAEISRHEEAAYHVAALIDALNGYSEELSRRNKELALKGTVWGAGFPVLNVEVAAQSARDARAVDYLGPSVDLGFRLAAHADRRRVPISADIALFLKHSRSVSTKASNCLKVFLDPPLSLKGIHAGSGYPMLWVDRLRGKETAEDRLLGRLRDGDRDAHLLEYLEEQFLPGSINLMKPFIETDPSPLFSQVPASFAEWRQKLMDDDPDLKYDQAESVTVPQETGPAIPPILPDITRAGSSPHADG